MKLLHLTAWDRIIPFWLKLIFLVRLMRMSITLEVCLPMALKKNFKRTSILEGYYYLELFPLRKHIFALYYRLLWKRAQFLAKTPLKSK
ncbi:hypothetical protein CIK78_09030 [Halomonas sp. JB37]|nr:hypothetical protein CIK78_09030 [Halomonas sp. JB37]